MCSSRNVCRPWNVGEPSNKLTTARQQRSLVRYIRNVAENIDISQVVGLLQQSNGVQLQRPASWLQNSAYQQSLRTWQMNAARLTCACPG